MLKVGFFSESGVPVVPAVIVAERLADRMVGLLGRRSLDRTAGMWINPCPAIHTWFMMFTIDAVFLDSGLRVVRRVNRIGPFRAVAGGRGARSVLEVATGWLAPHVGEGFRFTLKPGSGGFGEP
jgi:uncharacterized membrane protein (UPF0127 family)